MSNEVNLFVSSIIGFSSEYNAGNHSWSASNLIGTPTCNSQYGDSASAWCPANYTEPEYVEVKYDYAIYIRKVKIYENLNGGSVIRVEAYTGSQYITIWSAERPQHFTHYRIFEPEIREPIVKSDRLRITIDSSASNYFCELDAIEICGPRSLINVPESNLVDNLSKLFDNSDFSDVKIEFSCNRSLSAHRNILFSRCVTLYQHLESIDFKSNELNYEEFHTIMYYIYTDRLNEDNLREFEALRINKLIRFAIKFKLDRLEKLLIEYLLKNVFSNENILDILLDSISGSSEYKNNSLNELDLSQVKLDNVELIALDFIKLNIQDLVYNPKFQTLPKDLLCYAENLHGKWHFNEIRAIFSRRYLLQNVALEIFTANRSSVMFSFNDRVTVKKVVNLLPRVGAGQRYGLPQTRRTSLASPQQLFRSSNMTQKWQRREISNFEYLMYLNTISGRTYNDLNQYPIFPWILNNYDSPTIDLNSPSNYRDLSKPIGALNPSRRQFFVDRYQNWDNSQVPAFHYGTHYSTAAFTLNWLVRVEPYTSIFLNLQSGKFDHADRTFHSMSTSWKNCQRDTSDVKELIPEHFYLPEMFLNQNKFNFGCTQETQIQINDVELPKWAKNAYDFVRINRQALESEFVSCQLHQWIDLIFGYKQKGPEAIRACNVFYYLTYEGAVNLDLIDDTNTRAAIECQIKNFGQTPSQLLTEPHPPRSSAMTVSPLMFNQANEDICMMMKFLSNAPIVFVSANTNSSLQNPSVITISAKHEFSVNKYNHSANQVGASQGVYEAAAQKSTTQQVSNASSNTQAFQPPIQQILPLQMDQLLVFSTALHKRQLGDNFDDKLSLTNSNFIVTYDNKFIIGTGFWDKSFRVFSSDNAKLHQIIYGHFDLVTCVARSEMTQNGNCFIATGSRDSIIMLWIWSGSKSLIVNKDLTLPLHADNPSPGAILTGHTKQINSILVSSELGLVISASEYGPVLVHTVYGDLLRQFDSNDDRLLSPSLLNMSQDAESICVFYKPNYFCINTLNGKQLTNITIDDTILAIVMSSDGQYIVMGGEKGIVYVYRTHELNLVYTYPTCDASIRSLALTHDQKYIIAGLATGCLIVFNINFNVISYRKRSISSTNN